VVSSEQSAVSIQQSVEKGCQLSAISSGLRRA